LITEVTAIINLNALRHNFNRAKSLAAQSKVIAMVKSNAYGHGLIQVAHTLKEADAFGVARLREALTLREAAVTQDIVLMPGFLTADQLLIVSVNNLQIVVHNDEQLAMLEQVTLPNSVTVWLKIDTGMGRLGYALEDADDAYKRLCDNPNVANLRFMTHFATVDETGHPTNDLQFERLTKAQQKFPGEWTAAKSAAVMGHKHTHHQWVRPGLMLYGVSPLSDKSTSELDLKPVMTLTAPIISIRELKKDEPVGYGSTFICPEDMQIAVIGIGYGDGYPRHANVGTPVLINGKKAPRIGRVCMDMMMVDLRGHENVAIGNSAVLWGDGLPAEEVAADADTIAYEIFCSVTKRVKFEYVGK
jgi:alanine racemase